MFFHFLVKSMQICHIPAFAEGARSHLGRDQCKRRFSPLWSLSKMKICFPKLLKSMGTFFVWVAGGLIAFCSPRCMNIGSHHISSISIIRASCFRRRREGMQDFVSVSKMLWTALAGSMLALGSAVWHAHDLSRMKFCKPLGSGFNASTMLQPLVHSNFIMLQRLTHDLMINLIEPWCSTKLSSSRDDASTQSQGTGNHIGTVNNCKPPNEPYQNHSLCDSSPSNFMSRCYNWFNWWYMAGGFEPWVALLTVFFGLCRIALSATSLNHLVFCFMILSSKWLARYNVWRSPRAIRAVSTYCNIYNAMFLYLIQCCFIIRHYYILHHVVH